MLSTLWTQGLDIEVTASVQFPILAPTDSWIRWLHLLSKMRRWKAHASRALLGLTLASAKKRITLFHLFQQDGEVSASFPCPAWSYYGFSKEEDCVVSSFQQEEKDKLLMSSLSSPQVNR